MRSRGLRATVRGLGVWGNGGGGGEGEGEERLLGGPFLDVEEDMLVKTRVSFMHVEGIATVLDVWAFGG